MPLKQQLMEDMKSALKAHETVKLDTIRFAMSEIKKVEIDKGEQTDEHIQQLIAKQVKQMEESNTQYLQVDRQDLVDENNARIAVLRAYLPAMMSATELSGVVKTVIEENPGQGVGPIIGLVRQRVNGHADGADIATEVKRQLAA